MKYLYLSLLLFSMVSCTDTEQKTATRDPPIPAATGTTTHPGLQVQKLSGSYVSPDYAERAKGYDWLSVSIEEISKKELLIRIRSRTDKKRPSCTLDARASMAAEGIYKTMLDKGAVVYTFVGQALTISQEPGTPEGALNFYCSGGASIAGTYTRIEGAPDTAQYGKTAVK